MKVEKQPRQPGDQGQSKRQCELSPKRRRELLERAAVLGNVSLACAEFGVSRTAFYKYRKLQRAGKLAATGDAPWPRQPHPQTTAPATIGQLVVLATQFPAVSGRKLAKRLLADHGIALSVTTVCKILKAQNLGRVERGRLHQVQQPTPAFVPLPVLIVESPEKKLAVRFALRTVHETVYDTPTLTERATQPEWPGQKLCQFVFLLRKCGHLGAVYVHCVLDTYNAMAWARLSLQRTGADAATFLEDEVWPFFVAHKLLVRDIYTPRNRVFCAPPPRKTEGKARLEYLKTHDPAFYLAQEKTQQRQEREGLAGAPRAFMPTHSVRPAVWNPQGRLHFSNEANLSAEAIEWRRDKKEKAAAAKLAHEALAWRPYQNALVRCKIRQNTEIGRAAKFNYCAERFHRTLRSEFFTSDTRENQGLTLEALQSHLDAWLKLYNQQRPHPGYPNLGKPPAQRLVEFLAQKPA